VTNRTVSAQGRAFCAAVGITAHQLTHWTDRGYLHADNAKAGTGSVQSWPDAERAVAACCARMVRVGKGLTAGQVAALGLVRAGAPIVLIQEGRAAAFASVEDAVAGIVGTATLIDVERLATLRRAAP
jgi:hypothetical protein